jgi:hypothetical protein
MNTSIVTAAAAVEHGRDLQRAVACCPEVHAHLRAILSRH